MPAAARRRRLLDAIKAISATLTDAGCRVAFFMPLYGMRRRLSRTCGTIAKSPSSTVAPRSSAARTSATNISAGQKALPLTDTHMRVVGPAVMFLQQTFAEDWFLATRESLTAKSTIPIRGWSATASSRSSHRPGARRQPAQPDRVRGGRDRQIRHPYRDALLRPDAPTRMALIHACYRGVRVRLALPTRSNYFLVMWAGRSFYPDCWKPASKIYEYDAEMLHRKSSP